MRAKPAFRAPGSASRGCRGLPSRSACPGCCRAGRGGCLGGYLGRCLGGRCRGRVGDGLLPLAGGAEHLFGEGALLGDQVLGEVEYGVEDLLRVARRVTRRTGPAAHCFHQLVAALAPLLPEVLEVLLGAAGQLGELLLWTGHSDLLLDVGAADPPRWGHRRSCTPFAVLAQWRRPLSYREPVRAAGALSAGLSRPSATAARGIQWCGRTRCGVGAARCGGVGGVRTDV